MTMIYLTQSPADTKNTIAQALLGKWQFTCLDTPPSFLAQQPTDQPQFKAVVILEEEQTAIHHIHLQTVNQIPFTFNDPHHSSNHLIITHDGASELKETIAQFTSDTNAFTTGMYNHIASLGGNIAADNALDRALAAGRKFVEEKTLDEHLKTTAAKKHLLVIYEGEDPVVYCLVENEE